MRTFDHRNVSLLLRAQNEAKAKGWYSVRNISRDEDEVFIYGVIGGSFFDEGVEPLEFVRDLRTLNAKKLTIRVNSPGGNIFAARAIRANLLEHDAEKTTVIDGVAASAGSWIASGPWRTEMTRQSRMFIHSAMGIGLGFAKDLRQAADELDSFTEDIADTFVEKAGKDRAYWLNRMEAETWYSDREAVDAGLADGLRGEPSGENTFDTSILAIFENTPKDLLRSRRDDGGTPSIRKAEDALREAGLSRSEAKRVLANGWDGYEDEEADEAAITSLVASLKKLNEGVPA